MNSTVDKSFYVSLAVNMAIVVHLLFMLVRANKGGDWRVPYRNLIVILISWFVIIILRFVLTLTGRDDFDLIINTTQRIASSATLLTMMLVNHFIVVVSDRRRRKELAFKISRDRIIASEALLEDNNEKKLTVYRARVVKVIGSDIMSMEIDCGFNITIMTKVRLDRIYCKRGGVSDVGGTGEGARSYVAEWLSDVPNEPWPITLVTRSNHGQDIRGRWLVVMYKPNHLTSLNSDLLNSGFAEPYDPKLDPDME